MISSDSAEIEAVFHGFRANNSGQLPEAFNNGGAGGAFMVFYFNKKNVGKLAYSAPKATGQNADAENLEAMLLCQKVMGKGYHYQHGVAEEEMQLLTDLPHPQIP